MHAQGGESLDGKSVELIDDNGVTHLTKVTGGKIEHRVALGEFAVIISGYKMTDEEGPGLKMLATGRGHTVEFEKLEYEVELLSPREGEVYIVGSRIPIKARIKKRGEEVELERAQEEAPSQSLWWAGQSGSSVR